MKQNDVPEALRIYDQIKMQKVEPTSYMFQMILSLIGNAKEGLFFNKDAFRVYEDLKNISASTKLKIDETSYSALLKLCSRAKDFKSAEEIIGEMETSNVAPKLRTFSSLLQAYCEQGNLAKCLWVYDKIKQHDIEPIEADFMHLLSACTKKGASENFYHILDEYIECILQPSPTAWKVLQKWFER
jgi:pentatricopeptide repeat protein